ncbi:hypothetical protein SKAU_G00107390 [Synaphobranchus kaupii]|uniref:Uncharacterized protein n=1 Tax=Synaphobranchus kaupii TaxID=118154 RepID=A0A9Q1J810_SYNKA|nr:hypothetical protein SKAU_G00107390 [Synaphobranchus kaupii]
MCATLFHPDHEEFGESTGAPCDHGVHLTACPKHLRPTARKPEQGRAGWAGVLPHFCSVKQFDVQDCSLSIEAAFVAWGDVVPLSKSPQKRATALQRGAETGTVKRPIGCSHHAREVPRLADTARANPCTALGFQANPRAPYPYLERVPVLLCGEIGRGANTNTTRVNLPETSLRRVLAAGAAVVGHGSCALMRRLQPRERSRNFRKVWGGGGLGEEASVGRAGLRCGSWNRLLIQSPLCSGASGSTGRLSLSCSFPLLTVSPDVPAFTLLRSLPPSLPPSEWQFGAVGLCGADPNTALTARTLGAQHVALSPNLHTRPASHVRSSVRAIDVTPLPHALKYTPERVRSRSKRSRGSQTPPLETRPDYRGDRPRARAGPALLNGAEGTGHSHPSAGRTGKAVQ